MTEQLKIRFSISICPTSMERDGDLLDEDALLQRIRGIAIGQWGDGVTFDTLQVGSQQGEAWAHSWIDGKRDDSLAETLLEDWVDWTDEDLYTTENDR